MGIKVGTGVASGNFARGLDSGQSTPRAYLLGGQKADPFELYANVGTTRNANVPEAREWLGHISALTLWNVRTGVQLGSISPPTRIRSGIRANGLQRR